jgi:hypothetical protein
MQRVARMIMLLVVICQISKAQQPNRPFLGVLSTPVDDNTVVRFYYLPQVRDHYIHPLVLRVATHNEDQMQNAPLLLEGVTAYISLSEMKSLVAKMIDTIEMPLQTGNREVLGSFQFLPETIDMDAVIIYSKGAARGSIAPKDICAKLEALNSTIRSPRALWQFQLFRRYNACLVPNFDSTKY